MVSRQETLVARNVIIENTAITGGGLRFCFFLGTLPEPLVTNNIILGNFALEVGGGVNCQDADPVLWHTTIDGNGAALAGGGAHAYDGGQLAFHNTIVTNSSQGGGLYAEPGATITTDYCDVWHNTGGDYLGCVPAVTDISGDPEFCLQYPHDVRLFNTSCCQGSGSGGTDIGACSVGCFRVPHVVFYDNFSDQNDEGWLVQTAGEASMQVVAGTYQGSATGFGSWARSVVGPPVLEWRNYQFWVEIKPLGPVSEPGGWLHIYLRYEGPDSHYLVRLNGQTGQLWKTGDFGLELLAEFACVLPADQWGTLRFVAVEHLLEGHWTSPDGDEILLFRYYDVQHPLLAGYVGVGVATDLGLFQALFDDVLVALTDDLTAVAAEGAASGPQGALQPQIKAYPNPFNPRTRINFYNPGESFADLKIYNVRGELIRTLAPSICAAGWGQATWDGTNASGHRVAAGIYYCVIQTPARRAMARLTLIR
jgi:hypothetical protein